MLPTGIGAFSILSVTPFSLVALLGIRVVTADQKPPPIAAIEAFRGGF